MHEWDGMRMLKGLEMVKSVADGSPVDALVSAPGLNRACVAGIEHA